MNECRGKNLERQTLATLRTKVWEKNAWKNIFLLSRAPAEPQTRRLSAGGEASRISKSFTSPQKKLVFSRGCAYSADGFMGLARLCIVPLFFVACAGLGAGREVLRRRPTLLRGGAAHARAL